MDTDVLPYLLSVCSALGGYEENTSASLSNDHSSTLTHQQSLKYVMGDECLECLKDIKRYLRVDSFSKDRKVLIALGNWNILQNDLVPILLLNTNAAKEAEAIGKRNEKAEKISLAIVELLVPMTWPVDPETENFKKQLEIHRTYKEAFLTPGVLSAVLSVLIIPLSVPNRLRTVRDHSLIRLTLFLFRNLLVIPDTYDHTSASAEEHRRSTMQEEFLLRLQEESIIELVLTFASSSDESEYSQYNVTILEMFCAIYKGIEPESLFQTVKEQATSELRTLINKEKIERKHSSRTIPTRHSRFGGTIAVKTEVGKTLAIHKHIADPNILQSLDEGKKSKNRKPVIEDDFDVRKRIHSSEALVCLRKTADLFLQSCFNPFFLSLRNDVELERSKIRTEDTARVLYLLNFFIRFQRLAMAEGQAARRNRNASAPPDTALYDDPDSNWDFDLIGAIMDVRGFKFVVKRVRTASEDKLYDELHIAIECFNNMLLTLNIMADSLHDEYKEIAESLQNNLFYDASTMDLMVSLVKTYKPDMSKGYLRALVDATHTFLRMLERYSKKKQHMFVRKKAAKRKRTKKAIVLTTESGAVVGADETEPTVEQQPPSDEDEGSEEDADNETMLASSAQNAFADRTFDFPKFEAHYATEKVVTTYCSLLQDYKTLPVTSLKSITAMFHRIFFRVKAAAVFYKLSTLELFYRVLTDLPAFAIPRLQVHDDLKKLLIHVVRSMFQKLSEYPLLYVEILFPKTRTITHRIQHADEDEDIQDTLARGRDKVIRSDDEMEVKPGLSWSQRLGVAVSILVEKDRTALVEWIKTLMGNVIKERKEILRQRDMEIQLEELGVAGDAGPEGFGEKITDFEIKGENEEQTIALQKCGELRLLLKQLKCVEREEGVWVIPADEPVDDLELNVRLLEKFVADPLAPNGKSLSELLRRKKQAQKRKQRRPELEGEEPQEEAAAKKKRAKNEAEERNQYKSEQFIADSDEDEESVALFFQRESQLRARMAELGKRDNVVPIHELSRSLQKVGTGSTTSSDTPPPPQMRAKRPLAPPESQTPSDDSDKEEEPKTKPSRLFSDDDDDDGPVSEPRSGGLLRSSSSEDETESPQSQRSNRQVEVISRGENDECSGEENENRSPSPGGRRESPTAQKRKQRRVLAVSERESDDGSDMEIGRRSLSPDGQRELTGSERAEQGAVVVAEGEGDEGSEEEGSGEISPDVRQELSTSERTKRPAVAVAEGEGEKGSEKENEFSPDGRQERSNSQRAKRRTFLVSDGEDDGGSDKENQVRLSHPNGPRDRSTFQRAKRRAVVVSDGEEEEGSEKENESFNKRRAGRDGVSPVATGRTVELSSDED